MCRPRGIQVCDLPPVTLEGAPVSSTRIRKALEKGGARQARELLGHPFPMISRWSTEDISGI